MIDMRKTAIYSRKSKFTGKGESIESQIDMCSEYISREFPNVEESDILIFEDEGYSGGNTNRPQFQKLLKACRERQIAHIVCYKLDRISRSIADFLKLTEELEKLNVNFVSINDKYETHTATGRAMLQMTMVFAQLERETIAERIRDNMLYLAKDGRWLGGNVPTGYRSVETESKTRSDGTKRKVHKLEIVEEEAEIIKLIFNKYLEFQSLTKVETYTLQNDIKTKNGNDFSRYTIKGILFNPVYMIADEQAWNYFQSADLDMYCDKSEFDGIHGMMVYNKTNQRSGTSNQYNDMKEWVITVGRHKGIISGNDWVQAQILLNQNKSKSYRKPKSEVALLSGLLYCGNCGSFMRPKLSSRTNKNSERIYDYLCERKEKSHGEKCNMKRPNGNELDRLVCEEVKRLSEDSSDFMKNLKRGLKSIDYNDESYQDKIKNLKNSKTGYENKINNLINSLSESEQSSAHDYIIATINELAIKIKLLDKQIQEYTDLANTTHISESEFEIMAEMLSNAANSLDNMTVAQKRTALRSIIRRIEFDGENVHIYFFGSDENEIDLSEEDNLEPLREGCK